MIRRFLSKPMKATRLHAKEDIVSAAHAFAVALSEGNGNVASAKVGSADPSPIDGDLAAKSLPSTRGHGQSVAGRESRAAEKGADQAEKRPTISTVSHQSIGQGAPIRHGKWRRSIAATIIAIIFLSGGTLLIVKASPVEFVRDAYVRTVAEFQRRTGLDNVGLDTTARNAADRESITKETGRNATEAKLADEAAARRKKQEDEAHDAAEQKPTTEAVRKAAEDEARVVAPEVARRPAAEDSRPMAEPVERKAAAQKSKSDVEIRNEAQRAEAGLNLSEQDRKKVQASLSALGNQVPLTGYFGPVTRTMIAAWQNKQSLTETGFLNESQLLALHEQAALTRRGEQAKPVAQQPEKVEAGLNLSEQDRKKVQVALNSLGHPIATATGVFGPRTRAMITAWQKAQGLAETGYLTEAQLATLWQQAAPALSKYIQVQRKQGQE